MKVRGERIHFHGLDRSDYFFLSDTIIRIEATHGGKHSILITSEGEQVEVRATVAELDKRYGRIFLRCHQSYLVNPLYIRNIRRFKVTMTDGAELYGMVVAKPDITYDFDLDMLSDTGKDLLSELNEEFAAQSAVDELIKKYPVFEVRSLTPQTHEADTDMNINGYLKYAGIIMLAAGLILLMVQRVMKRTKSQNS